MIAPVATGSIVGFGGDGYRLAVDAVAGLLGAGMNAVRRPAARWTWPARIGRLPDRWPTAGCDALLVTDLLNIRYLTGFTGSAARLLVQPGGRAGARDRRPLRGPGRARSSPPPASRPGWPSAGRSGASATMLAAEAAGGVRRLGLEAASVTWADQQRLRRAVPRRPSWCPPSGLVEELRLVKDAGEVARLQRAADIAGEALANVFGLLDDEPTEAEFAPRPRHRDAPPRGRGAELRHHRGRRARTPACPTTAPTAVASARATWWCSTSARSVDGYHSDMTRTAMLGEPVARAGASCSSSSPRPRSAGVAAVRAGVAAADVDAACRDVITAAGWGERFTHGTGHGVGLRIHEAPWVNATSTDVLVAGCRGHRGAGRVPCPLGGVRWRTPWSSWPTAAARSPPLPRIWHACDHHQRPEERDDARSSTTGCSPSSSSSTSSRARAAPSCAPR